MDDPENFTICPVCSGNYRVEGDHVPRILPCFHTVCEGCIKGKLGKGTSLECPECGIEHTAQNGIKNIQENRYIISHLKQMAEKQPAEKIEETDVGLKKQCRKHGKEHILFCNEPDCQVPICLTCLKDDHKAHDFSDLQEVAEERCAAILQDVQSMKKALQEKKEDLLAVQKIVAQNCKECSKEILGVKGNLIREIDSRGDSLVRDIKEQKENTDASINEAVAEIDKDLVMLSTLEKTNSDTVFQTQTETLEELKNGNIHSRFPQANLYTSFTYKTCVGKSKIKHLSILCGKLTKRNRRTESKKIKARAKYAIPADETDKENKVSEQEVVSASDGPSVQEERKREASNLSAMTPTSVDSDECCKTQGDCQEEKVSMDGCLRDKETTNSLFVEDISTDEEDHTIEKFQENVLTYEERSTEMINKVYGPIAEIGLLKDSKEMVKNSYLPTDSNLFSEQKDNGVNTRPAENITGNIQPAENITGNIQPAENINGNIQPADIITRNIQPVDNITGNIHPTDDASCGTHGLTPPTFNMVRNIQPIGHTAENYQPSENVIVLNRPENPEPSNIIPLFSQSANSTFQPQQPAENPDVFVQPGGATVLYGYQPASLYGCQIYGQMNSSTGPSITDTPSPEDEGTMNSHHVNNSHATRSGQVPQNPQPHESMLTQPQVYGLRADPNGNDGRCFNTDGIGCAPCHGNITGCGSRDPRIYRSLLYGKRADSRDENEGDAEAKKSRLELPLQVACITNYRVLQSISTGYVKLNVMDLLPDDTIVVSGKIYHKWSSRRQSLRPKLTKYDINTGRVVYSSWYTRAPDGMAVFTTLAGNQWLALSYGKRQAIEFCDMNNLRTALENYSVSPDYPGRLCTSSPGTLVYTDCKPNKQVVKWLDCSNYPPTPSSTMTNIQTRSARDCFVQDMCFINAEGKQLLITTHNLGGVHGYLAGTDELEWCLRGRQKGMDRVMNAGGVTTDGRGQLLVCDLNNGCIQMLSMHGVFLGTVLRSGDQRLGNPLRIRYCSKTEFLVIAHEKQGLCSISIFQ